MRSRISSRGYEPPQGFIERTGIRLVSIDQGTKYPTYERTDMYGVTRRVTITGLEVGASLPAIRNAEAAEKIEPQQGRYSTRGTLYYKDLRIDGRQVEGPDSIGVRGFNLEDQQQSGIILLLGSDELDAASDRLQQTG